MRSQWRDRCRVPADRRGRRVRATGAGNVLMLGGPAYSNDLTGWPANKPSDPDGNLVASWHSDDFNSCSTEWTLG